MRTTWRCSKASSRQTRVVVVSHRGNKHRPNEVLAKARAVGAPTTTITGEGPAAPEADVVLRTCPQEQARTHTVS